MVIFSAVVPTATVPTATAAAAAATPKHHHGAAAVVQRLRDSASKVQGSSRVNPGDELQSTAAHHLVRHHDIMTEIRQIVRKLRGQEKRGLFQDNKGYFAGKKLDG
jgi:hypothetical protein